MSSHLRTATTTPDRDQGCHPVPSPGPQAPTAIERAQIRAVQVQLREVTGAALRKAGGAPWLQTKLNRKPTYETKINDGVADRGGVKVQLDWWAPLLLDPDAGPAIAAYVNEVTGHEPPVKRRVLSKDETSAAVAEVVAGMDPIVRDGIRQEVARRRGVRVEDVKL